MSRGINKVIIVGNLGADPEVRHTGGGAPICTFNLATSESWTDKQSGEKQERTEWHRVKVFGKLAEICGEYLRKGRQVYIEGSIRTERYTDKDGIERYATDVIASVMQMLGSDGGSQGGHHSPRPQDRHTKLDQRGGSYGRAPAPAPAPASGGFEDDEIPF